ncbi:MAG: PLP-dependent aminotransferase family protein [Ectothiorhodospiraceae bacterium]|nr:PLP-dependent aminotransferase family protein [Ectothiorhodospiraceae bacterium]
MEALGGHLYEQVGQELANRIEQGLYSPGDRLPGVRALSQQFEVSVATAVAAYRWLEAAGYVEARQRSGMYVRQRHARMPPRPGPSVPATAPTPVTGQEMVLRLLKAANDPHVVQFGAAVPDPVYLPTASLERAIARAARQERARALGYEFPPGAIELRRQIARRMAEAGSLVHPDELVVTNGCQEAVTLALRAVTSPGDVVAVESPTFYGLLQVIDSLGLEALEIPTDPEHGISVDALRLAMERWPVRACVVVPNYSNPLGFCMSDARKRALVELLGEHGVPLIEDDVYGDLGFDGRRPGACKGLAPEADILYCASFSKTMAPGLRIGWVAPGWRHRDRVEYLKYVSNLATPAVLQLGVAELLESGRYERHLRQMRAEYARAVARMVDAVMRYFPTGTRITRPRGGFVIWVELPEEVDTFELAGRALARGISIAPGPVFSARQKYRNCMRLSCACRWDARVEAALATLAAMCQ